MTTIAIFILMPIIATVAGMKIYMYFNDHNPPHFHAKHGDKEDVFDVKGNLIDGDLDTQNRKKVKKWALKNEAFLREEWDKHNPNKR